MLSGDPTTAAAAGALRSPSVPDATITHYISAGGYRFTSLAQVDKFKACLLLAAKLVPADYCERQAYLMYRADANDSADNADIAVSPDTARRKEAAIVAAGYTDSHRSDVACGGMFCVSNVETSDDDLIPGSFSEWCKLRKLRKQRALETHARKQQVPETSPARKQQAPELVTAAPQTAKRATRSSSMCAVPDCTKQSQGRANNYMCRRHYVQSQRQPNDAMFTENRAGHTSHENSAATSVDSAANDAARVASEVAVRSSRLFQTVPGTEKQQDVQESF